MKNFIKQFLKGTFVLAAFLGMNKTGVAQAPTQIFNLPPVNEFSQSIVMKGYNKICPQNDQYELTLAGGKDGNPNVFLYSTDYSTFFSLIYHPAMLAINAAGREITGICQKAGSNSIFYVMYKDGTVEEWQMSGCPPVFTKLETFSPVPANYPSGPVVESIQGDKIYVKETGWIETTIDTGKTWLVDTVGLGRNCNVNSQSIDTNQTAYVLSTDYSTHQGLYAQLTNSNTWTKVTGYTGSSSGIVWIDSKNTFWISDGGANFYCSINGGLSFTSHPAPANNIIKICDDAFGNVFCTNGQKMWRSADSGATWTRIAAFLSNEVFDSTANQIFNDISADSIVTIASNYGLYTSGDHGNTWKTDSAKATTVWGYQQYPNGRKVITTPLATYLQKKGDSTWTQTYPVGKYYPYNYIYNNNPQNGPTHKIYQDASGHLFMQGYYQIGSSFNTIYNVVRSNDSGSTWIEDTLGFMQMATLANGSSVYYADSMGTQHIGIPGSTNMVYSKTLSGGWVADTLGLGAEHMIMATAFTDAHGYVYASGSSPYTTHSNGVVVRRPITGGKWVVDTTGLSQEPIAILAKDGKGNLMGYVNSSYSHTYSPMMFERIAATGKWKQTNTPSGYQDVQTLTGTATGGWLAYTNFFWGNFGFPYYTNGGVSCSSDSGNTWNLLGLDSIYINQVEAVGDTAFLLSDAGLYKTTGCNDYPNLKAGLASEYGVFCNGKSDAIIVTAVYQGTAPYTYSWAPSGGTNYYANNLSIGTYTCTITDAHNLTTYVTATLTQPTTVVAVRDSVADNGSCNGVAGVAVNGGTPPYTYSWSPGGQTTDTIKNQCVGNYCCTIVDNNGCSQTICITVNLTTGVKNIASVASADMYPNPSDGNFIVSITNYESAIAKGNCSLQIKDLAGRIVQSFNITNSTTNIQATGLSNGVYFWEVYSGNKLIDKGKIAVVK